MRRLPLALTALVVSCAPIEPPAAEETSSAEGPRSAEGPLVLEPAAPISGLAIRPGKSGGRARRVAVGALPLEGAGDGGTCDDDPEDCTGPQRGIGRLGARGRRGVGVAGGGYGLGLGGLGTGGGGGGVGARHGEEAPLSSAAAEGAGGDGLLLPFAYAALELPYRTGPVGHFRGRPDARIEAPVETREDLLSTFAIDVDTAAFSIARRALLAGRRPEPSLVRVEEFVNYFRYDYDPPRHPHELFSFQVDGAQAPGGGERYLLRLGLMARELSAADRPGVNLVFLVDTSCSMTSEDRLPLAKQALALAVERLDARDQVAITTYAGGVSLVLAPTRGDRREEIKAALSALQNGGGTAMASGLELAYAQASRMLGPGTITRVVVCSDGDANIGASGPDEMLQKIRHHVSEGVFLSTVGFGDGNYRDHTMERIANQGNGNYYYVDDENQARRVFSTQLFEMLLDVAQDVKVQVAFDARAVKRYRLVGYENRAVRDEDFRDDRVDGGEIGAGHQVTALYELELHPERQGDLGRVHLRAKRPRGMTARERTLPIPRAVLARSFTESPADFRFAAAVMSFAERLRGSPHGGLSLPEIRQLAAELSEEPNPRAEVDADRRAFLRLVDRALALPVRLARR